MKSLFFLLLTIPLIAFNQIPGNEQYNIDSLKQVIKTAEHDTIVITAWEAWAATTQESDPELHESINLRIDSACSVYLTQNPGEKERAFYTESKADALSNLGRLYSNRGDYSLAIDYFSESLEICEKIDSKDGVAFNLDHMAMIYRMLSDYDNALTYYERVLDIHRSREDKFGIANTLNNIGNVYFDQEKDDIAQGYYEEALTTSYESGNKLCIATSLINKANIDNVLGNKADAIEGYKDCLEIQEEIGDTRGATISFINITDTYIDMGKYKLAVEYGKKALENSQKLEDTYLMMYSYNFLSTSYAKAGEHENALDTYKTFILLRDSMDSEENQKAVMRQQIEYEYKTQAIADSIKTAEEAKVQDALLSAEQAKNKQQKQQSYFLYAGLALTVLFGAFIFNRFQTTRKQKGIIEDQKRQVDQAFAQLGHRNKEIMDSINYAKRIQSAILPSSKKVEQHLRDSFILYKPKDIVAGDFYWLEALDDKVLFAAADCTGHGVPGAMVSVVCNGALNRSVREFGLTDPGKILDKTREIVVEEFEKSEEEVKDGMDIAFCTLSDRRLSYAGAHNPLWIVRNGEIIETKANKQPIGRFEHSKPYTTHHFEMEKGDTIYIFSDGYVDQFGGEKGKKFKLKALRELLLGIQDKSMNEQKKKIDEVFESWRGDLEQIDDVCIFGVRV